MCKNFNDLDALEDQAGHRAWLSARGCKETEREEEITKAWRPAILSRLHRGSNIIRGKCLRKEYLPLGTFVDNANVLKHQKDGKFYVANFDSWGSRSRKLKGILIVIQKFKNACDVYPRYFLVSVSSLTTTIFLQFNRNNGKTDEEADLWIAYCAFHLGDYKKAMEVGPTIVRTSCHYFYFDWHWDYF